MQQAKARVHRWPQEKIVHSYVLAGLNSPDIVLTQIAELKGMIQTAFVQPAEKFGE